MRRRTFEISSFLYSSPFNLSSPPFFSFSTFLSPSSSNLQLLGHFLDPFDSKKLIEPPLDRGDDRNEGPSVVGSSKEAKFTRFGEFYISNLWGGSIKKFPRACNSDVDRYI